MLLTVVISIPALTCVLKIIDWGGKHFYVYVWAFCFVFSIFMLTIVPVVIMPLFNTYSPLEVCITARFWRSTTGYCVMMKRFECQAISYIVGTAAQRAVDSRPMYWRRGVKLAR